MEIENLNKITALKVQQGRNKPKRVKLFLNGKPLFSLEADVVVKKRLKTGATLSEADIIDLTQADAEQRCYDAAARYLSYRPRSESELKLRLRQKGFAREAIDAAVVRLKEQHLLDDSVFARFWVDNRTAFRPRSRQLTRSELRAKGVDREIIEQTVENYNEADNAYKAALSKLRSLSGCDADSFRRKLGGYLARRGFDYEVINHTTELVWEKYYKEGKSSDGGNTQC
jgi:regulatory protein